MERILESIRIAKARGATMRVGPELEVTSGGSNEFQENDLRYSVGDMDVLIISSKVGRNM